MLQVLFNLDSGSRTGSPHKEASPSPSEGGEIGSRGNIESMNSPLSASSSPSFGGTRGGAFGGVKGGIFLLFLLVFFTVSNVSAQVAFTSGDGTAGDPYIITTAEQLAQLATYVNANTAPYNAAGTNYKLGADIDLSAYGNEFNDGQGWIPIGTSSASTARFKGIFDGGGHVIKDLYINNTTLTYSGLFGYNQAGAVVRNVGIIDAEIISTPSVSTTYTGGVAAFCTGAGNSVSNCWFTGSVISSANTTAYIGGIVGSNAGSVSNCYTTCPVNSTAPTVYAGGITGNNNGGVIANCWSISEVNAKASTTSNAGGISGQNTGTAARTENCAALNPYSNGTSETRNIGRVVGNFVSGTLSNNIGLVNMVNLTEGDEWSANAENLKDGEDITISAIINDGTLGARFSDPLWTIENGKLPGFENSVSLPDYFTGATYYLGVKISPKVSIMKRGQSQMFFGKALGFNLIEDVSWEVEGETAETSISSSGELTIAENEYSIELTVIATSTVDNTKSNSAIVYITGYDGLGTEEDPFIISSAAQLAQLATYANEMNTSFNSKYYKLASNIDLSDYGENFNNGAGWIPIGLRSNDYGTDVFYGVFDGDGYTITGLYINNKVYNYSGLFGGIETGTIKNLGVENADITTSKNYAGGILAITSNSTISNCWMTGTISGAYVGGISAYNSSATIKNCYTSGVFTGVGATVYAGGLVGYNSASAISNCWSTAFVNSHAITNSYGGGIVARNYGATNISNCAALNPALSVIGATKYSGRVCGNNTGSLANNIAYNNMLYIPEGEWTNHGFTLLDGEDFSATDFLSDGTLGGRFVAPEWTSQNGFLPGLGKTIAPPKYLTGEPFVNSINIEPNGVGIKKGSTLTFTATVYGFDITGTVEWSVSGGVLGTVITSEGILTVHQDETSSKLSITATSTDDNSISSTVIAAVYSDGDGSVENPFVITTPENLLTLSELVNSGNNLRTKHFKLGNDIDLSVYGSEYNNGEGWIRIGHNVFPFTGSFDGNNHIISGLYINNSTLAYAGLFGYLDGVIKNLGLLNVNITSNSFETGGLVGNSRQNGNVSNCYVTGSITGTGSYIGGIVGMNEFGSITKCYFEGEIKGTPTAGGNIGGIAGYSVSISYCYFSGTVTGYYVVGGIVGTNDGSGMSYCYSMGTVGIFPNTGQYTGGLAGTNFGNITNCWTTAKIVGNNQTAGLGRNLANIVISNSAALNPEISAYGGSLTVVNCGRVGSVTTGTYTNNVGFENMINPNGTTTWYNKGQNLMDGADISLEEINSDGTLGGRFTTENGWIIENGKLPGLFGSAVEFPSHLFLPDNIYEFSGKVTGSNAPEGITGAVITLSTPGIPINTTTSGENGQYYIEKVYDTKIYNIKVEAAGYVPFTSTVTIEGDDIEYDINLEEIAYPVVNVLAEDKENIASITWTEPGLTTIFRYDSGVSGGGGMGYNNGTRMGVLGSAFKKSATVNKISWYLAAAHAEVDLFIFGLGVNGAPNAYDLLFTVQNVPNASQQWCEYNIPIPIYAPEGFFIGVSASNGGNLGLCLDVPDEEYPFVNNTHYATSNFSGSPFRTFEYNKCYQNPMIRAEGIVMGETTLFSSISEQSPIDIVTASEMIESKHESHNAISLVSDMEEVNLDIIKVSIPSVTEYNQNPVAKNRSAIGYKVYRFEEGDTEEGWVTVEENTTETEFNDSEWATVPSAAYRYAVKALYSGDIVSSAVISNLIGKDWTVNYQINITTNTGEIPVGAVVTLMHHDGESNHIYKGVSDADGVVQFENIWRGIYYLSIKLKGYQNYFYEELDTDGGLYYDALMYEIPYPVSSLTANVVDNQAIISWTEPATTTLFRHDSGIISDGLGFLSGTRLSVIGSTHKESALITKISWFSHNGAIQHEYDLWIFGLNENGTPNRNNVLYNVQNIPNIPLQWCEFELPEPVEALNGFFIGASASNGGFLGLGIDEPNIEWPFQPNTNYYSSNYTQNEFSAFESTSSPQIRNAMIRAEGIINGKTVTFGYNDNTKAYNAFNVYRLLKGQTENWTQIASAINELSYTDNTWNSLAMGEYQYAVRAIYTGNVLSPARLSNVLEIDMRADLQVNITTNSGHPATGATVTLTNRNGDHSYIYTQTSEATGILFTNIRKGFYNITIKLTGYEIYTYENLNIMQTGSHPATLIDKIFPVGAITAEEVGKNAVIKWDMSKMINHCVSDVIGETLGMSATTGGDMTAATRFTPDDLIIKGIHTGYTITKVILGIGSNMDKISTMQIRIWEGGTSMTDPGTLVYTQPITNYTSFTAEKLVEIKLTTPFVIDASKELRIGWRIVNTAGYPFTCDLGPAVVGKGDLFVCPTLLSGAWFSIRERLDADENFIIKALVTDGSKSVITTLSSGNEKEVKTNLPPSIISLDCNVLDFNEPVLINEEITPRSVPVNNSKSLKNFTLYRLLEGANVSDWDELATNYTEMEYVDTDWFGLAEATYQYAIVAYYGSGESEVVFSNPLVRKDSGINEIDISGFSIYPNPTTSELRIENGELKMERINIYNAVGQIVMEISNVNSTSYKLNVEMLSSGVYFISVQTKIGVIKSKFVVK